MQNDKLKFRNIAIASVVLVLLSLLVFLFVSKFITEVNARKVQIIAAHGGKCKQIAGYMQDHDSFVEVNNAKSWPSRISKHIVQNDTGCGYQMIVTGGRVNISITGIYLPKVRNKNEDGSVLLGYTDILSLPGKEGVCYAFFMSGDEVFSVLSDEEQIRRIVGNKVYEKTKALFYYMI